MWKKIKYIYHFSVGLVLLTTMGIIALSLRIISFGLLTDFNRKHLVPAFSKAILYTLGITLENEVKLDEPERPHFYTFNHASHLDTFILMCLGLTNTRLRLEQLYGPAQSMSLEKLPDRGTRVTVAVPWRLSPPSETPLTSVA